MEGKHNGILIQNYQSDFQYEISTPLYQNDLQYYKDPHGTSAFHLL